MPNHAGSAVVCILCNLLITSMCCSLWLAALVTSPHSIAQSSPFLPPCCSLRNKISKKKEQISKAEINAQVKDDLKTVALGTSKINYLDPRITVAWCKRHEVPIEKVFNKSLLSKFFWAMDCDPEFKF